MASEYVKNLIQKAYGEKAEFLDLGNCRLTEMPKEIIKLAPFLRELNLGSLYKSGDKYIPSGNSRNDNNFSQAGFSVSALENFKQLTHLHVYFAGLTDAGAEAVARLGNLTSLDISDNQLTDAGAKAVARLGNLTHLYIGSNQLKDAGAEAISRLGNLTNLDISYNQLTDAGAEAVARLGNLINLSIWGNQLTASGAKAVARLGNLTHLYISRNQLTASGAEAVARLGNLTHLYISGNQLTAAGAKAIARLGNLTSLDIRNNGLKDAGAEAVSRLGNLTQLDIGSNELTDAGAKAVARLGNLTSLEISNNKLGDAGAEAIAKLRNLQELRLNDNQITSIAPFLYFLTRKENPLQVVVKEWYQTKDGEINVQNNPLETPPMEVVRQGTQFVIDYLQQAQKHQLKALNECKVIIIGDGAVGKTSLMKRLVFDDFNPAEQTTHGINKIAWNNVTNQSGENITVNLWDFGGQHLQHSLHQFFFSERVLYILVLNPRTCNTANYWLEQVEKLGGNSPVLAVYNAKNEKDTEASFESAYYELQKTYKQLGPAYKVCCENGDGIAGFRDALKNSILQLPDLASLYPENWFNIKKAIEEKVKLSRNNFYVHYNEYKKICEANDYPDEDQQKRLLKQLDQAGSIVFFDLRDNDHLQVLNPEWITTGAYAILTSSITREKNGYLTRLDLKEIFKVEKEIFSDASIRIKYQDEDIRYIIGLMLHYNLCEKNPFDTGESYLVPAALTGLPKTDFSAYKTAGKHYIFQFSAAFEMLIIHRFIARNLSKARETDFWQSGILIKDEGSDTWALVETDQYSKLINFWISGTEIRGFWESIRRDMKHICKIYKNFEPVELVLYRTQNQELFLSYSEMLTFLASGIQKVPIVTPGKTAIIVDVWEVLENFRTRNDILEKLEQINQKVDRGFDLVNDKLNTINNDIIQLVNLTAAGKKDLEVLLQKVDTSFTNEQAAAVLEQIDTIITEHLQHLPEQLTHDWKKLNTKAADEVEVKGKLKFKIPIIPAFLTYENELTMDLKKVAQKLRGLIF